MTQKCRCVSSDRDSQSRKSCTFNLTQKCIYIVFSSTTYSLIKHLIRKQKRLVVQSWATLQICSFSFPLLKKNNKKRMWQFFVIVKVPISWTLRTLCWGKKKSYSVKSLTPGKVKPFFVRKAAASRPVGYYAKRDLKIMEKLETRGKVGQYIICIQIHHVRIIKYWRIVFLSLYWIWIKREFGWQFDFLLRCKLWLQLR